VVEAHLVERVDHLLVQVVELVETKVVDQQQLHVQTLVEVEVVILSLVS
tara:strand:+ start:638 stop:784 length:147 start_codon:yes stop_codon:yes gene_type:complete